MFKEKGYDQFLADCLHNSEEDIQNGKILTLEQSMESAKKIIEKKSSELNEFQYDISYS